MLNPPDPSRLAGRPSGLALALTNQLAKATMNHPYQKRIIGVLSKLLGKEARGPVERNQADAFGLILRLTRTD
jgi:hypothetical protein